MVRMLCVKNCVGAVALNSPGGDEGRWNFTGFNILSRQPLCVRKKFMHDLPPLLLSAFTCALLRSLPARFFVGLCHLKLPEPVTKCGHACKAPACSHFVPDTPGAHAAICEAQRQNIGYQT